MNTVFFRIRVGAFLCALLLPIFGAKADSPASAAGWTFELNATSATVPFTAPAKYRLYVSDSGTSFGLLGIHGASDSSGTCRYVQTTLQNGRFEFNDSVGGPGFSAVFTFDGSSSGTFFLGNTNYPGYQRGKFIAYSAAAPAQLDAKRVVLTVSGGTPPFDSSGSYRIVTGKTGNYVVEQTPGVTQSEGDFWYSRTNRSSGVMRFNDSEIGAGMNVLTFATSTSGTFLLRRTGASGYQVGTFTLSDYPLPTFTQQPASRTVQVSSTVTLSATVSGAAPLSYQWFKNGAEIPGANAASYTIDYAQLSDAGSYHVVASNSGGSTSSTTATLTVVCGYSLSTNAMFFDFTGAEASVTMQATGDCGWQAGTTNDWISIASGTGGLGDGTITFNVAPNFSNQPRTGSIHAGGKLLTVAQGPEFAAASIAGKTIILTATEGAEAPGDKFVFVAGSGTNSTYLFIPLNTNSTAHSGGYVYSKSNSASAALNFDNTSLVLEFNTPVSGTFSGDAGGNALSGQFVIANSQPDLNSDGLGDLLLQNSNRILSTWLMSGTNFTGGALLRNGTPVAAGWRGITSADFNRDGRSDVLLAHDTGKMALWLMNQTNVIANVPLRAASGLTGWTPVSANDFNADTRTDLLVKHSSGRLAIWHYNGTNFMTSALLRNGQPVAAGWNVMATADFNGDAQIDILFRHDNGQLAVWLMNGAQLIASQPLRNGQPMPLAWKLVAKGDFNFDGQTDLVWHNAKRQVVVWLMNGTEITSSTLLRDGKTLPLTLNLFAPK